jgi:hypothetical protein
VATEGILIMAKSDRVRYVSTFRAPTEYERQLEEARRRAALAEALAQQEYQPMEGTVAPIPKAAPLVKALQGYLTAREGRKAQEAAEEAKGMEADYAQRMLGRMQGGYTYKPNAELEQQMAKRPEETLEQYNQRIASTVFTGKPADIPEQTELGEVTRQSQYRRAPEEVLGMASTSLGTAALKDRPIMAQRLAKMLEEPEKAKLPYNAVDMSKLTKASREAFAASVKAGNPDYTLLESREFSELTPQQLVDAMFRTGQFGIEGGRYQFETGQPPPQLRFPFQSQPTAAPAAGPAAAPQVGPPPIAPRVAPTAPISPSAAPRATAPTTQGQAAPEKIKPLPAIQTATPQQRLALQQDLPKARMAAQVGLGKLDQLDAYLADLENHAGLDRIAGKLNQYEFTDVDPSALSARSVFNGFLQGTSIQSVNEARQASQTGGAFGTMTEKEWPRLEGAFGAVVAAKEPNDLRRAIRNARAQIAASRNRYTSSWEGMYGDMNIGYEPPKYEPESMAYPREKPKQSESRSIADKILEEERNRARGVR